MQSGAGASILFFFRIGPKSTNLVEDVDILLPTKIRWILFSSVRTKAENVSANQRPGRQSCFPDQPEKQKKLVDGVEILLPVNVHWIPFSGFMGEVENVSVNQVPGRQSCFQDRPEKRKLDWRLYDLTSCQVSLNSVQRFQRKSRKCESLRRTPAGRPDDAPWQKLPWAFCSSKREVPRGVRNLLKWAKTFKIFAINTFNS